MREIAGLMKFDAEEETRFSFIKWPHRHNHDGFMKPNVHLYRWHREVALESDPNWKIEYHLWCEEYDIAKWMIDSGYPMTQETMTNIVYMDDLAALKWLKEHGCPWDKKALMREVRYSRDRELVEWVKSLPG